MSASTSTTPWPPIVTAESLDYEKVFAASRYDRGEADYLNCPFNKAEYEAFHAALASAERAPLHEFDAGAEQGAQPDHAEQPFLIKVRAKCLKAEFENCPPHLPAHP